MYDTRPIPVEERLPDAHQIVLAYVPGIYSHYTCWATAAHMGKNNWLLYQTMEHVSLDVTHWLPLPPPPEAG